MRTRDEIFKEFLDNIDGRDIPTGDYAQFRVLTVIAEALIDIRDALTNTKG